MADCWSRRSTYARPESMASPSIANRTRMRSAMSTMAWPSWRRRWALFVRSLPPAKECTALTPPRRFERDARLVRVLGTVDRICSDDDSVANNLLDQRGEWVEVEPERHLDRLVADRRSDRVATRPWRGQHAQAATRPVGHAVAGSARVGDEDPARIGGRQLQRADRVAAVRDGAVGARVGEHLGHCVNLDSRSDVGVGRPGVRRAAGIDEVRSSHRDAGAFVSRLLERDVEVQATAEVDDAERHQKDDRGNQRELDHALGALATEPSCHSLPHGWPWIVKCSLYINGMPLPNMFCRKGVMRVKFMMMATLMSPRRHDASAG